MINTYDDTKLREVIKKLQGNQTDINDNDMIYINFLLNNGYIIKERGRFATGEQIAKKNIYNL